MSGFRLKTRDEGDGGQGNVESGEGNGESEGGSGGQNSENSESENNGFHDKNVGEHGSSLYSHSERERSLPLHLEFAHDNDDYARPRPKRPVPLEPPRTVVVVAPAKISEWRQPTVGLSYSQMAAFGVGIGAEVGVATDAAGIESSFAAYGVAGPIVAIPLPFNTPSVNFNFNLGAPGDAAITPVDCSALGIFATPLFSLQYIWDEQTGEGKSLSASFGLNLQLGLAAGVYCGFGIP